MKDFEGKVAAITGAGSGIGRSLAIQLAERKCDLALSDVNDAGLAETVDLAGKFGVKVTSSHVDVADKAAVFTWAEEVVAEHGKVNLIFNNAGVALGATIESMSYEDFEWLFNINFWGVIHGTKAFLPHLKAAGEGHIINTSSVFGFIGVPSQSAYNAAKFGVRGFTEALREELDVMRCGVSATCVHPGGIKTNIAKDARMTDSVADLGMNTGSSDRLDQAFITTPEKAAKVIISGVQHNRRRVLIGPDARVIDLMVRLLPSGYQRILATGTRLGGKLDKRFNR